MFFSGKKLKVKVCSRYKGVFCQAEKKIFYSFLLFLKLFDAVRILVTLYFIKNDKLDCQNIQAFLTCTLF